MQATTRPIVILRVKFKVFKKWNDWSVKQNIIYNIIICNP